MKEPIIQVKDLTKSYGDFEAVRGISFEVYKGEIFGLLGPNGAGKSTTLKMIAGCLSPDAGSLQLSGIDLQQIVEVKAVGHWSANARTSRTVSVDPKNKKSTVRRRI